MSYLEQLEKLLSGRHTYDGLVVIDNGDGTTTTCTKESHRSQIKFLCAKLRENNEQSL